MSGDVFHHGLQTLAHSERTTLVISAVHTSHLPAVADVKVWRAKQVPVSFLQYVRIAAVQVQCGRLDQVLDNLRGGGGVRQIYYLLFNRLCWAT